MNSVGFGLRTFVFHHRGAIALVPIRVEQCRNQGGRTYAHCCTGSDPAGIGFLRLTVGFRFGRFCEFGFFGIGHGVHYNKKQTVTFHPRLALLSTLCGCHMERNRGGLATVRRLVVPDRPICPDGGSLEWTIRRCSTRVVCCDRCRSGPA